MAVGLEAGNLRIGGHHRAPRFNKPSRYSQGVQGWPCADKVGTAHALDEPSDPARALTALLVGPVTSLRVAIDRFPLSVAQFHCRRRQSVTRRNDRATERPSASQNGHTGTLPAEVLAGAQNRLASMRLTIRDDPLQPDPLARFRAPDRWYAYHGTSALFATAIDDHGLSRPDDLWSRAEHDAVIGIYESIQWEGASGGGYPVLAGYARSRELGHVYLAETFARATLYASFPGGETTRALVKSLEDLIRLRDDPKLQEVHREYLARNLRLTGYPAIRVALDRLNDQEWLIVACLQLEPLLQRLIDVTSMHEGVVYLVELSTEVLSGAYYSQMGIEVNAIPFDALVAKATTVALRDESQWSRPFEIVQLWLDRFKTLKDADSSD